MKGGIEVSLVLLFGLTFSALLISLTGSILKINHAKIYAEQIVDIIEHHDGYTDDAQLRIAALPACVSCVYTVSPYDGKFDVKVRFDINLMGIEFSTIGQVQSTSKIIN
jgi:hypothetical protein